MARLTPLAKGLITVIILGAAASAAWHLGLADKLKGKSSSLATNTTSASTYASSDADHPASTASDTGTGPLGSPSHPLKVSIVSFHGYAPALVANGDNLDTQTGSIYDKLGLNVKFLIQDDIPTLSTIFEAKTAECAWRTSDFWAQEQPNLRNSGLDGRAVMIVDNTQGADAIIARDPNIRSVEDLAGKKIALLQYTPSHGMVIDAIDNSSMTARKKASVQYVFVNAEEGTAGVRSTLESGNVDAAALWDPDLSLAIHNANAHVVYSTKTASNLIFDVMVCDSRVLASDDGRAAVQKFVQGWMEGVKAARQDPDNAVEALVKTEQYFELLAQKQGRAFIKGLFSSLVWTGLEDNARILGMAGDTNHYERVYQRFDGIYRAAGALANPKSPVIAPQDSFDYSFIRKMLDADQAAKQAAAAPQQTFTVAAQQAAIQEESATVTKPVTVNFASGSAELSKRSQKTIDDTMVPFIQNNGSAYFEVSGNTDSTGNHVANMALSQARAKAVVDYLVEQWEFPRERFKAVGNGPDHPICDESNAGAEGMTLDDCRAANRTTRVAVFSAR
jgi:outer membrane protein OmpA-like peptidoglycan-associated protein/ABC-type amino acid transport substrate-binding protein